MRIFLLADNWMGWKIAEYLKTKNENIIGLAIHGEEKRRYSSEILNTVNLASNSIFDGTRLRDPQYTLAIKKLKPDLFICCGWAYILKPNFIAIPSKGVINLHPGFLPYNRGVNPNVWPIIENTPAGSTLHYIDPGVDTGPIIAQSKVPILPTDTGGTLYNKTIYEMVDVFKNVWPKFKKDLIKPKPQNNAKTTFHLARDLDKMDKINLEKNYTGREFINILRARTYQDRTYAYYFDNGKKIFISVVLSEDSIRHYPGSVAWDEGYLAYKSKPEKRQTKTSFENHVYELLGGIKNEKSHTRQESVIPLTSEDKIVGYLRAVTKNAVYNAKLISDLSVWRDRNQMTYMKQFKITDEKTKKWIKTGILEKKDRILFIIETTDGRRVGHIGLNRFNFSKFTAEIDNVLRGNTDVPGIMTIASKALMDWGRKKLNIQNYLLQVFEDNKRAVDFYSKIGFQIKYKKALYKSKNKGPEVEWVEGKIKKTQVRYLIPMEYVGRDRV
jgi:methionyl-tRNA formyltransferase/RimJ/RimL family protein N-acetyltransferase